MSSQEEIKCDKSGDRGGRLLLPFLTIQFRVALNTDEQSTSHAAEHCPVENKIDLRHNVDYFQTYQSSHDQ